MHWKSFIQLLLLIALSWSKPNLLAQDLEVSLSFEHLTVDDGLSHSIVNALLEDHLGNIWVGTNYGLNRFDGFEFQVYLPESGNTNAIRSQIVRSLWESKDGHIWVGHLNSGLSVWDRDRDCFYTPTLPELSSIDWSTISINCFFEDRNGQLWIGTYDKGAIVLDPNLQIRHHFWSKNRDADHQLKGDDVFDFVEDQAGRIWIATDQEGIQLFDPSQQALIDIPILGKGSTASFDKTLHVDGQGAIWIGTTGTGLYQIEASTLELKKHFTVENAGKEGLISNMISDISSDANGNIWIATDGGGLYAIAQASDHWRHYTYSSHFLNSLNSNALYQLLFDRIGNLWVGTYNGGLNVHQKYEPPFFRQRQYSEEKTTGLRSVLSITQDRLDKIWLGTDGGGLFQLDPLNIGNSLTPIETLLPNSKQEDIIKCMQLDERGGLWIGTFANGLSYSDPEKGIVKNFQTDPLDTGSLSSNNVWDLALDAKGGLWIGTLGGGISYLKNGQSSFERLVAGENPNTHLSSNQVNDILLDQREEKLWIATDNGGLNSVDIKQRPFKVEQYHSRSSQLSSERIHCLFEDTNGLLWIGTSDQGINILDPMKGEFRHIGSEQGLPSLMVNSIIEDEEGYFWISTQGGIVRWDDEQQEMVNIGFEPNQENNQYNLGAAFKLADGRLLFGSTNGYSIILPDQLQRNQQAPEVIFTELKISNEIIPVGKFQNRNILTGPLNEAESKVQLSFRDKGVSFYFTSNDYAQAAKHQYAYRLMGFDTTWQIVGKDQRSATFSALPGGDYELQVKAADYSGLWSKTPRIIQIKVLPPYWQTWWFTLTSILLGIAILLGTIQVLLARQKARFQKQTMLSEREILRLKNENLEKDILNKQSQLNASVLQMAHHNEVLTALKKELKGIDPHNEKELNRLLKRILRKINAELNQADYWEQFQLVFDQTFHNFMLQIREAHPSLTSNDHRLCCFIKMQLSNREIASILNVTINGVEQAKYRLKKKLDLAKAESLHDYIQVFGK